MNSPIIGLRTASVIFGADVPGAIGAAFDSPGGATGWSSSSFMAQRVGLYYFGRFEHLVVVAYS